MYVYTNFKLGCAAVYCVACFVALSLAVMCMGLAFLCLEAGHWLWACANGKRPSWLTDDSPYGLAVGQWVRFRRTPEAPTDYGRGPFRVVDIRPASEALMMYKVYHHPSSDSLSGQREGAGWSTFISDQLIHEPGFLALEREESSDAGDASDDLEAPPLVTIEIWRVTEDGGHTCSPLEFPATYLVRSRPPYGQWSRLF